MTIDIKHYLKENSTIVNNDRILKEVAIHCFKSFGTIKDQLPLVENKEERRKKKENAENAAKRALGTCLLHGGSVYIWRYI